MKKKRVSIWCLGAVILALTFFNTSSFADLTGSKMSGCYDPVKSTACFEIVNKSPDSETITSVELEFAEGWKVQCGSLSEADSCGNTTNFGCSTPQENICSLGGWASGIGAGCTYDFCVDIENLVPVSLGSLKVDYSFNNDELSGSFILLNCNPPELKPTAVPTLSEWGLILFTVILGIVACLVLRRRSIKKA